MKSLAAILLTAILVPAAASAQAIDLGPDVSAYTRFVVYPHLQKGLEAMQRGDRDRAFAELERARQLAPGNAVVALQLATAYRTFGENARAETLLREQLKLTPSDERVKSTLAQVAASSRPAPARPAPAAAAPAPAAATPAPSVATARPVPPPSAPRAPVVRRNAAPPRETPATPVIDPRVEAEARFATALRDRQFASAESAAGALIALDPSVPVIDEVSFKLVDAGAGDQALSVLLQAYPFAAAEAGQRDILLQRMIPLLQQRRQELGDDRFLPLRRPLDTPALRSRQAVLWANVGECDTVRAVLGDLSPAYGHDDWVRLGDCAAATDPVLARRAYAAAHALMPGGSGSIAFAYATFADGEYRASLDAWRTVGAGRLAGDDLLAASATALEAGDDAQALAWLESYRAGAGTLNDRYWSLLGRGRTRTDAPGAITAFERAVALNPDVDDLLRLSLLETEPAKRVQRLEQAAQIAPTAGTLAQLGYAYEQAGRAGESMQAFEKSVALEPANASVQAELGFAYWRAGRIDDAAQALERAYQADPANMVAARQLVYAEQRRRNNGAARRYAERVLDTPGAFTQGAGNLTPTEEADLRFGLQRLHEDLGRRVTVSLDGFSGTNAGGSVDAAQPGRHFQSYAQIEADVRLGKETVRNGRTLSAYARVFGDGGETGSAIPSNNATLGAGLRWKPFGSQVVYFAAEAQNGLEEMSRQDVLLRASASFLNGGRFSDDWHPARAGWFSQNLYLDAARYLKADFNAFTGDYRTSYHKRIAGGSTLEPYTHIQLNLSGAESLQRDIRAGAGLRWNIWYGGSKYDAAPRKLSFGIEFQQALDTYLPEDNGVFLTIGSRW